MQRLRITFSRKGSASYLSHLEMMRLWERAFRRAEWRLTYSQGFNPHPRISFAAPLPVGVAGDAELLDVYLEEPRIPETARVELAAKMPPGVEVKGLEEVDVETPALPCLVQAGEYRGDCPPDVSVSAARDSAGRLLSADSLPRERAREGKVRCYDLRPMIRDLWVEEGAEGRAVVGMLLRVDAQGAGRPDEVLRAMEVDPADCGITRLRLLLR